MRQVQSDKYNVAWFALAECITRGEKERALGVYRLLSHSIEDQALIAQLEGDILWAFNDDDACKRYFTAAELYLQYDRRLEAAAVLEHLATLEPDALYVLELLITIYKDMHETKKALDHAEQLITTACKKNEVHKALQVMHQIEDHVDAVETGRLYKQLVLALLRQEGSSHEAVSLYIKKTIDAFLSHSQSAELQKFLSKLQAMSNRLYRQACQYIEKDGQTN